MIYYIQNMHTGSVKIGWTERKPRQRLKEFQTACDAELELIATHKGDSSRERWLHHRFSDERIRKDGEWFRASEQLVEHISKYGQYLQREKFHPILKPTYWRNENRYVEIRVSMGMLGKYSPWLHSPMQSKLDILNDPWAPSLFNMITAYRFQLLDNALRPMMWRYLRQARIEDYQKKISVKYRLSLIIDTELESAYTIGCDHPFLERAAIVCMEVLNNTQPFVVPEAVVIRTGRQVKYAKSRASLLAS